MRHFPIYLDTEGKKIVVSGAGECAMAKLRLLFKTEALIEVFDPAPHSQVRQWADEGLLTLFERPVEATDFDGAILHYAAEDDLPRDRLSKALARKSHVPTLIVDNLDESDFITPSIVDRDPVTIAIGTEGAAPVLGRKLKADIEEMLPQSLGPLARIGKAFRTKVLRLPAGRKRRDFWSRYYFEQGPAALQEGEWAVEHVLNSLLAEMQDEPALAGHVHFVGAGPGDPDLLTLRARKLLHEADVVLYDRLVPQPIIELARREAVLIEVGKTPFGPSWKQEEINALIVKYGKSGQVVRLKSGDPAVFGRLEEETEALDVAGIPYSVTPGITAALCAAASIGASLTKRGKNRELRLITAHDAEGFAEQDWRGLAKPDAVTAIYMGKAAAEFFRGRLLMHGAAEDMPVTIVENASRPDQRIVETTLTRLPQAAKDLAGPAVILLGIAPRNLGAVKKRYAS